jgi:hypothetical protein
LRRVAGRLRDGGRQCGRDPEKGEIHGGLETVVQKLIELAFAILLPWNPLKEAGAQGARRHKA